MRKEMESIFITHKGEIIELSEDYKFIVLLSMKQGLPAQDSTEEDGWREWHSGL